MFAVPLPLPAPAEPLPALPVAPLSPQQQLATLWEPDGTLCACVASLREQAEVEADRDAICARGGLQVLLAGLEGAELDSVACANAACALAHLASGRGDPSDARRVLLVERGTVQLALPLGRPTAHVTTRRAAAALMAPFLF